MAWDCAHLVRLPGTRNHKPDRRLPDGTAPLVRVVEVSGRIYTGEDLRRAYPPDPHGTGTAGTDDGDEGAPIPIEWDALPLAVRTAINSASTAADQSAHFFGLVKRCRQEGLNFGQTRYAIGTYGGAPDRYRNRLTQEIRRVWPKAGTLGTDALESDIEERISAALDAAAKSERPS